MIKFRDFVKIIKNSKRAKVIIWVIALVLFIILSICISKTKSMKKNYNNGNKAYKLGNYEDAERYYKLAMWEKPGKRQDCKIRINRALSIVTPITPESVDYNNLNDNIARLEEARDLLCDNDCAHMDDSDGHNKKAQKLKEEIEDYIIYLKEENPPPEEKQDENEDEDKDKNDSKKNNTEERDPVEARIEELLKQAEMQGLQERYQDLDKYADYKFDFYYGKKW